MRLWLINSKWGPLVARATTAIIASASAAGGWKLASYIFSRTQLRAPAVVTADAVPKQGVPDKCADGTATTFEDVAIDAGPVVLVAKPHSESTFASPKEERDGPSPVFEAEDDETEHRPEDVVDTRIAIRSVRDKPGSAY